MAPHRDVQLGLAVVSFKYYRWRKEYVGLSIEQARKLPCTLGRTFACLLREAMVDTITIKGLGKWGSLEMVQRYTRSVTFNDSRKLYEAPLS